MALSTKAITTRIKSVKNTKKITKAMEMVAASKMRKAVERSLASREYAERALELLAHVSKDRLLDHPLIAPRNGSGKVLLVIMGSNRGLCGGYNVSVFKNLNQYIKQYLAKYTMSTESLKVISVGKYAERYARKLNLEVVGSFIDMPDEITVADISGLSQLVMEEFEKGIYDKVQYLYTNYISPVKSEAIIRGLLPIQADNIADLFSTLGGERESREASIEPIRRYTFEPDEETTLNEMLPRLTEVQLYQALLESKASEHSARMVAMKNASDNAGELVKELTLSYNKARQAAITQEITEIAAAASAVGA